jgi:hypothetical protein
MTAVHRPVCQTVTFRVMDNDILFWAVLGNRYHAINRHAAGQVRHH